MSDIVDIYLAPEEAELAENISGQLHLGDIQNVVRVAIAYAVRHGVPIEALEARPSDGRSWKASQVNVDNELVTMIKVLRPDEVDELATKGQNRCLEALANRGVRKLHAAMESGSVESLSDLLPD